MPLPDEVGRKSIAHCLIFFCADEWQRSYPGCSDLKENYGIFPSENAHLSFLVVFLDNNSTMEFGQ